MFACEAYLEQGLVVRDVDKLRRNYVYTWQFPLDVVSLLPTDLLYLHFGVDFAFVRINRVLRVGRMLEFFDRTDSRTNYPHIFRVLQLVIYMIVSIHWNACLYYQISVWIGLGTDKWVCLLYSKLPPRLKKTRTATISGVTSNSAPLPAENTVWAPAPATQ